MNYEVDFDYDRAEEARVLAELEARGGRVAAMLPNGPGGGNPNILARFETRDQAVEFLCWLDPNETATFHRKRVRLI